MGMVGGVGTTAGVGVWVIQGYDSLYSSRPVTNFHDLSLDLDLTHFGYILSLGQFIHSVIHSFTSPLLFCTLVLVLIIHKRNNEAITLVDISLRNSATFLSLLVQDQ
jgi:hypothetical protein